MKKNDIQRMLSQVDEKYISEITESDVISDTDYADEVSGEVEVVKHISHWRNWAAAAAALIVCVGIGAALIRPAMQHSQFEVADSAGCYDFIDSLTENDLDQYFLNQIEDLPDFPIGTASFTSSFGDIDSVIGKNLFDTMKVSFSDMHDCAEICTVNPEVGAVIARVWDNPSELDFSQAEAYHIDDYDVDFYGAFLEADSEPMPVSHSFFSYHDKMYHLYTDTLSKKDTLRIVYEILDADLSAKKLWLEYGMSDNDFIPYFTYAKPDGSNLDYYDESALYDQYGDHYEYSIDHIAPPVGGNYFDQAEQLFLNDTPDKSARFNMANQEHSLLLSIYDNPQININEFTTLTPYHIDDYDIDFYGLHKYHDGNPIQNATMGIFLYHDKLYILNTTDFTRQETIKLVYEILDSDISAESLYQQYQFDIMSDEDFIPYFTEIGEEDSVLNYYRDDYYFDSQYGEFTLEVNNAVSPFIKNQFDTADYIWFNENSDRKARASMTNAEHGIQLTVYDNVQVDMSDFITRLTPYHLDDYDIDFYGLYKTHDTPIKCSTACVFRYHDRLYVMTATNFTRQETMKLVYEILDSDISAESLYQQYCGDIVNMEDSRIITLEDANQLEFCKGMIPQLDTLQGENEQSNGRNLGMNGDYVYNTLYDDSDLILQADTLLYVKNEDGEQLSYTYSNAECYLHITYTSFLPDNANLAEHYSPKITLKNPFSYSIDGQDDNSRLRNWDFWLDLGTCYVHLDGNCSMNHEDSFINGLSNIIEGRKQEIYQLQDALYLANTLDFCKNLVPQMTEVSDMQLAVCNQEEDAVYISYSNDETDKILNIAYHNTEKKILDIAVPILTPDQLTEEGLEFSSMPQFTNGFAVNCQKCAVVVTFGNNTTKEEMMPYLTELKNLILKYDSDNTDLQQFNQNKLWGGLVPEIQKIGSLEFQGITEEKISNIEHLETGEEKEYSTPQYVVHYCEPNVQGHELNICYTPDDSKYVFTTVNASLGGLQDVPLYGGDGSEMAFDFHAGTFSIYIDAVGCTRDEINEYIIEFGKTVKQNPQIYDEIVKYLNQQEAFKDCIPELSGLNNMKLDLVMTNLTLDENAPRIHIAYVDEENVERKLQCSFMKDSSIPSEATALTIEEIDGNLQIEAGQYEHFELFVDCHGWYAWIVGENCYKEDLDCYLMALAENYRDHH